MPKGIKNSGKKYNTFEEVPCIVGIDQSYTRTGITVAKYGKIHSIQSVDLHLIKSKTAKRLTLQKMLSLILNELLDEFKPEEINIIVERIRTFTASTDLRPDFMKSQAALIAIIVDTAYIRGIKTYSVDTRAWKNRILGSADPIFEPIEGVKNPQKFGSVRKIIELGHEKDIKMLRGYNDDAADSACIALYAFSGHPYKLNLEQ